MNCHGSAVVRTVIRPTDPPSQHTQHISYIMCRNMCYSVFMHCLILCFKCSGSLIVVMKGRTFRQDYSVIFTSEEEINVKIVLHL